jgi:hypothetical protein
VTVVIVAFVNLVLALPGSAQFALPDHQTAGGPYDDPPHRQFFASLGSIRDPAFGCISKYLG